jgi:hypothetical protein
MEEAPDMEGWGLCVKQSVLRISGEGSVAEISELTAKLRTYLANDILL